MQNKINEWTPSRNKLTYNDGEDSMEATVATWAEYEEQIKLLDLSSIRNPDQPGSPAMDAEQATKLLMAEAGSTDREETGIMLKINRQGNTRIIKYGPLEPPVATDPLMAFALTMRPRAILAMARNNMEKMDKKPLQWQIDGQRAWFSEGQVTATMETNTAGQVRRESQEITKKSPSVRKIMDQPSFRNDAPAFAVRITFQGYPYTIIAFERKENNGRLETLEDITSRIKPEKILQICQVAGMAVDVPDLNQPDLNEEN